MISSPVAYKPQKRRRNSENLPEQSQQEVCCCICRESEESLCSLRCKHPICLGCSQQLRDPRCPLCRMELTEETCNIPKCELEKINQRKRQDQEQRETALLTQFLLREGVFPQSFLRITRALYESNVGEPIEDTRTRVHAVLHDFLTGWDCVEITLLMLASEMGANG